MVSWRSAYKVLLLMHGSAFADFTWGLSVNFRVWEVVVSPGATQFTRIPSRACVAAALRTRPDCKRIGVVNEVK